MAKKNRRGLKRLLLLGSMFVSMNLYAAEPCVEAWDANTIYTSQQKASKDNHNYQARWWTQGEDPASAAVWTDLGNCGTIVVGKPPVVSMTYPQNNTTLISGQTITLQADASDPDGTVTKVEFYQGTSKIGETTTAPYIIDWMATGPQTHQITAVATDNDNVTTTSAPVTIVVEGGIGPVEQVKLEFAETGNWIGGYNGKIFLKNEGHDTINGWKFSCDLNFTPDKPWGANVTTVGNRWTFENISYNGTMAPGAEKAIGFGGSGKFYLNKAENCTFNGNPINAIMSPNIPPTGGINGTSGIDFVGIDPYGENLTQITIDHGVNTLEIAAQGVDLPNFELATNNSSVLAYEVTGTQLKLTGLTAGRASLKLRETATGKVRYVGVRVRTATGQLPGYPNYLTIGSVSEDSDADLDFWKDYSDPATNKRMDIRYIYINGGPITGWHTWSVGPDSSPGIRARSFIRESRKLGMLTSFVWYNIPDTDESHAVDVSHIQDSAYMEAYFKNLKFLLDIITEESPDEPVKLVLEPDFIGYLSQYGDPVTLIAKADAARTAGVLGANDPTFPNTVRGLIETINYILANSTANITFGWQFNLWASPEHGYVHEIPGVGILHLTDDNQMGLTAGRKAIFEEASAITQYYIDAGVLTHGADFVSIDKYGLDAVGLEAFAADDPAASRWFFNNDQWSNYLEFVRAMHVKSNLPVVLWQLPVGHINGSKEVSPYHTTGIFPDFDNITSRSFEDSAPSYFFGDTFDAGTPARFSHFAENKLNDPKLKTSGQIVTWGSHMEEAAAAGVSSILFGAGVNHSTDSVGTNNSDHYWWIHKVQKYFQNPFLLK